jgi:enoyl-CoA hydratase/carnithine racemase
MGCLQAEADTKIAEFGSRQEGKCAMSELVTRDWVGSVCILTMNDPEQMNLFSPALRNELISAFGTLGENPDCRAIILAGAGAHFSAGGDIKSFQESDVMSARARLRKGSGPLARLIVAGTKPVIAAVQGNCYGAGLSLVAASDYVVTERSAKFCAAFMRLGLIPDVGLLWSLPRRVGHGRAKLLMALASVVVGADATQMGLADEVVDAGQALNRAKEVAAQFAASPPVAMALLKSAMSEGLENALKAEIDFQPVLMTSDDHAEAKRAFFEKRPAAFLGR